MSATTDEQFKQLVKADFLSVVSHLVALCASDKNITEAERCERVAWNILAVIDGVLKLETCTGFSLRPMNGDANAPDIAGKLHEEYLHGL